jgi:septin 7
VIEVENEAHCDFVKLRHMLIRTHMEELKDDTNYIHYENYRIEKWAETGGVKEEKHEVSTNMYSIYLI